MGASLYLSYAIKTSKFGLGLLAIGQNEDAAAILGVPTPRYKALVYSASAFLPAIAGGLYFFKSAFIQPSDAFDLTLSTEAIVICMLGGQGTVTGVALGAYLYEELRGYLLTSSTFSNFQLVIAGVLLLLIVLFFPSGLMGFVYSRFPRTEAGAGMTALLELDRVSKRFGGLQAVSNLSFVIQRRRNPRPDRAERRRQIDAVQSDQRRVRAEHRQDRVRRHRHHRRKALHRRPPRARPHASDRAAAHQYDGAGKLHGRRLLRPRESAAAPRPRGGARGGRTSPASTTASTCWRCI